MTDEANEYQTALQERDDAFSAFEAAKANAESINQKIIDEAVASGGQMTEAALKAVADVPSAQQAVRAAAARLDDADRTVSALRAGRVSFLVKQQEELTANVEALRQTIVRNDAEIDELRHTLGVVAS